MTVLPPEIAALDLVGPKQVLRLEPNPWVEPIAEVLTKGAFLFFVAYFGLVIFLSVINISFNSVCMLMSFILIPCLQYFFLDLTSPEENF